MFKIGFNALRSRKTLVLKFLKNVTLHLTIFFLLTVLARKLVINPGQFANTLVLLAGYSIVSVVSYFITKLLLLPLQKKWLCELDIIYPVVFSIVTYIFFHDKLTLLCDTVTSNLFDITPDIIYSEGLKFMGVVYIVLKQYVALKISDQDKARITKTSNTKSALTNKQNHRRLKLYGKNKDEYLFLKVIEFIYLKSEGHYIVIHYKLNGSNQIKSTTIRNSMIELEKQTEHIQSIYRCHKSYMINTLHLKSVTGNVNKSIARLTEENLRIPISKSKISFMKAQTQTK